MHPLLLPIASFIISLSLFLLRKNLGSKAGSIVLGLATVASAGWVISTIRPRHEHRPSPIGEPDQVPIHPKNFVSTGTVGWLAGQDNGSGANHLYRFLPDAGNPLEGKFEPCPTIFLTAPDHIVPLDATDVVFWSQVGMEPRRLWRTTGLTVSTLSLSPPPLGDTAIAGNTTLGLYYLAEVGGAINVYRGVAAPKQLALPSDPLWLAKGPFLAGATADFVAFTGLDEADHHTLWRVIGDTVTSYALPQAVTAMRCEGKRLRIELGADLYYLMDSGAPVLHSQTISMANVHGRFYLGDKFYALVTEDDGNEFKLFDLSAAQTLKPAPIGKNLQARCLVPCTDFVAFVTDYAAGLAGHDPDPDLELFYTLEPEGEPDCTSPMMALPKGAATLLGMVQDQILFALRDQSSIDRPFVWWKH